MTNAQHTPQASLVSCLAAAYTHAVVHNPKDVVYANIERAVVDVPLIAAAPELLAALKTTAKIAQLRGINKDNASGLNELLRDIQGAVNAAIARAEGK